MHQTRSQLSKRIPLQRKGTKYVARAISHHRDSVPVVIAIRDLLRLARTSKEVKSMIHSKMIKLNGQDVKDLRDSIKLFNILEAKKQYVLTLSSNNKFKFETFHGKERLCKVVNKRLFKGNRIQLNLHDGTNVLTKEKINVHDSVYLDFSSNIKKHVKLEKGGKVFILSGKYAGKKGEIKELVRDKVKIMFNDQGDLATLGKRSVIVQ